MNLFLFKLLKTLNFPLRVLNISNSNKTKSLTENNLTNKVKNPNGIYKKKYTLNEMEMLNQGSNEWKYCEGNKNISKRLYPSYDEYISHQKAKLALLDLHEYDRRYRKALRLRLKDLDIIKDKQSVLCLAARTGSEVKSFIDLGYYAVGIDLNPGEENRYVVSGDFHNLQFADNSIDIIFTNSLDHIYNFNSFIKEVKRVIHPNGVFIIEIIRGSEEGRDPGFFESLWWRKIDDMVSAIESQSLTIVQRQAINYPWKGEQLVFKTQSSNIGNSTLLFQIDESFNEIYKSGLELTGTPDRGDLRKARFYNLIQWLRYSADLPGSIAECGCWKGLSSYLICNFLSKWRNNFDGNDVHIFDSFKGLSEPNEKDVIQVPITAGNKERIGMPFKHKGAYSAEYESVLKVLKDFPNIELIKGWIPEVLLNQPKREYRLVHIDLDLYTPTKGATEYFLSRMVPGGIIICDDYGSLFWPGAKQAFDEVGEAHGLKVLSFSSGQGVLIKPN